MFSGLAQSPLLQSMWQGVEIFIWLWPVWVPGILIYLFFSLWFRYIKLHYIHHRFSFHLLEIRLPEEITKSPEAMEVFFNKLYQTGAGNFTDFLWEGKVRPWFSLELVSQGGDIRFFIWTENKWKGYIQSQLYSQYPDIEIYEVEEDYTDEVVHNPDRFFMWGTYFKEKNDVLPIKTYRDYKLDQNPKEEEKIEPMAPVLEYLGNLAAGEQVWIQILIRADKEDTWQNAEALFKRKSWRDRLENYIQSELMSQIETTNKETGVTMMGFGPPGVTDQVKELRKHQVKWPFQVAIRGMYITEHEYFDNANISGLIGSFIQYSSNDGNQIKLGHYTDISDRQKDFVAWLPFLEGWAKRRRALMEKSFLEAYKLRSFFYPPYRFYRESPFVLNVEELATIYHLPGGVVQTPTFKRLEAKKAEPPSNLPG